MAPARASGNAVWYTSTSVVPKSLQVPSSFAPSFSATRIERTFCSWMRCTTRSEDQAFGLERGPVEVHAYALAWARAGRSTPSRDGSLQRFAGRSPHHGPRGDLTHAQGSPYRGHPSQLPPNPAAAVSARLAVLPSAVQREIRQRSKRRRLASLHAYTLCTFRLEDAPAFLDTAGITEISMATAPAMALLRQWQLLSTFLT